jgi:hypothetical protein
MKTATIKYKGQELTCIGYYSASVMGTMEQPPESEGFEIDTIEWRGVDVTDLLVELMDVQEELEKLCLDNLTD